MIGPRVLLVSFACILAVTDIAAGQGYSWSLSGSSTDATVSTGPALASTPFTVYLWLTCSAVDGISAAEFSLQTNFFDAGFTPLNGTANAGNSTDLLLSVGGCPEATTIFGSWAFIDFTGAGGGACLVASPGGVNGTFDCDTISPMLHFNAVEGFSTDGSMPCLNGICTPFSSDPRFGWTISSSTTDPFLNTGVPANGLRGLALWLLCDAPGQGIEAAQFKLASTGAMNITSFIPQPGFQNDGDSEDLVLTASTCRAAPALVGTVIVDDHGGSICIEGSSISGFSSGRPCGETFSFANSAIGYSSVGPPPCSDDLCPTTVAVEDGLEFRSWGGIKALYRE